MLNHSRIVNLRYLLFSAVLLLNNRALPSNLALNPDSGPGNALVTLTSSGFPPDSTGTNYGNVGFYAEGSFLGACYDPHGSAWANCSIQARMPGGPGPHTITAGYSGDFATATFTAATPSFSIIPSCGPPDTQVTISGRSFNAVSHVGGIYIDDAYASSDPLTDESGNFTTTLTMPSLSEGDHSIGIGNFVGRLYSTFSVSSSCIGTVGTVDGTGTVTHPDGTTSPLQPGTSIQRNDVLSTGPNSRATMQLADGTTFTLSDNTKLTVDNYVYDPSNHNNDRASYNYIQGAFQYLSGLIAKKPDPDVNMETPFGQLGIRGTQFIARRAPCSSTQEVYLIEGQLVLKPQATGETNICNAPVAILFTSSNVSTSALTQATYDAISNEVFHTSSPITFSSWAVQYFGCTNNPAAAPDADPDGDGQSNLAEFLAGTDPTRSASTFRILSATQAGNDFRVTWQCGGGRTNVVQCSTIAAGGWSNLSGNIVLPGSGDVITNYVDAGTISNATAKFYRVQLIQ